MKISPSLANGRRTARQFQGCIRGTTIHLSEVAGPSTFDPLWLTVELTRGQVGLLAFKHKETENPVVALVDALVSRQPDEAMVEAVEAMGKLIGLAKVRPITQRDLVRLDAARHSLHGWQEELKTKIDALTVGD